MTRNYKQSEGYDNATQWKGLILFSNNTSIPVCLYVCVSPRALFKYHTSYFNNTSQSHKCIENTSKQSHTVTVIPVTLPADVSTPLAAVSLDHRPWQPSSQLFVAPSSRYFCGSYSSHLPGVELGPKDHPHTSLV